MVHETCVIRYRVQSIIVIFEIGIEIARAVSIFVVLLPRLFLVLTLLTSALV